MPLQKITRKEWNRVQEARKQAYAEGQRCKGTDGLGECHGIATAPDGFCDRHGNRT